MNTALEGLWFNSAHFGELRRLIEMNKNMSQFEPKIMMK
jgi:hypothetical protein